MKLENWSVISRPINPFQAPELWAQCLYGFVYDNPKFKDGTDVSTSPFIGKRGNCVVTQTGSEYELGEVDPNYEAEYPDAYNRLWNSLEEV